MMLNSIQCKIKFKILAQQLHGETAENVKNLAGYLSSRLRFKPEPPKYEVVITTDMIL
jgi:hypothetical protein